MELHALNTYIPFLPQSRRMEVNYDSVLLPPRLMHRFLSLSDDAPAKRRVGEEKRGSMILGIAVHFGPASLFIAALSHGSPSLPLVGWYFLVAAVLNFLALMYLEAVHPAVALPPPTLNAVVRNRLGLGCRPECSVIWCDRCVASGSLRSQGPCAAVWSSTWDGKRVRWSGARRPALSSGGASRLGRS